jgi:hypothetical protein
MEKTTMEEVMMEQATLEEQTDADVTTFTLYIPDFAQERSLFSKTPDKQNTELLQIFKRIGWLLASSMKLKLCFLTLLRSTVMMTTSMIQLPSNARYHCFFVVDVYLLASNKLTKQQTCSLEPGLSRR